MKIAITGGHLAPALAVIDELPKEADLIFIGRRFTFEGDVSGSLEFESISRKGIKFIPITAGRIQRRFSKHTLQSLFKIPYGFVQAISILRKEKVDLVLTFGGYISVPVGIAAYFLKVPLVIHEQTLEIGVANKLLSKFAKVVCISWQQSAKFFPKSKTVLTGNPLRKFEIHPSTGGSQFELPAGHLPVVYITGGSAGAHALNEIVEGCLQNLLEKYLIIHQTGDAGRYQDFSRISTLVKTFPEKLQKRYMIRKFIAPSETGYVMDKAALVVSRAGINTVNEMLYFGKPCLLIPLPYGQRNEQLKNAQFMKKTGLCEYVPQADINSQKLLEVIENMIENRHNYLAYSKEAKALVKPEAGKKIVKILYEVISKKK